MRRTLRLATWFLTLAYPWLWYYGGGARALAGVMAVAWLLRALIADSATIRAGAVALAAFFLFAALRNAGGSLTLYPLLVSGAMLAIFTASLIHPPTVIERLARLQHPDLPPEGVRYTRRITQIWCGFFIANGSIIAALALLHADRAWTWYTGFISYLLMGALFAGEWIYRRIYLPT